MCFDLWVNYVTSERDAQTLLAFSAGVGSVVLLSALVLFAFAWLQWFRNREKAGLMAELQRDLGVH